MTHNEKEMCELLRQYVDEYPAFRTKPVGAEGSIARHEQDRRIVMEDWARKVIARVEGG
jgi:hypothetical protein